MLITFLVQMLQNHIFVFFLSIKKTAKVEYSSKIEEIFPTILAAQTALAIYFMFSNWA